MLKHLLLLVTMFMVTPFIGASEHQRGATLKKQVKTKLGYVATSLPGQIIAGTGIGVINGAFWGKAFHGAVNVYDKAEDILQKAGRKKLLTATRIAAVSLLLPSQLLAFPAAMGTLLMAFTYQASLKKSGIINEKEDMEIMLFSTIIGMPPTFLKFAWKSLK